MATGLGLDGEQIATPPVFMAFGCVWRFDRNLRAEPLWYRRIALEEAIEDQQLVLPARRLAANGLEAWAQVEAQGYEGLVGKDEEAPYVGGPTLKPKRPDARDVVAARSRWRR